VDNAVVVAAEMNDKTSLVVDYGAEDLDAQILEMVVEGL